MMSRLLILGFITFMVSCGNNDLSEAQNSLNGEWAVISINTRMGEQLENGQTVDLDTTDLLATGSFLFEENGIGDFSYNTLGVSYNLSDRWSLSQTKVNCGFTNCDQYAISFDSQNYICEFGDQTSNAHKNATDIRLINTVLSGSGYTTTTLSLEK